MTRCIAPHEKSVILSTGYIRYEDWKDVSKLSGVFTSFGVLVGGLEISVI